jgi:murein DD-endopeptidase MepM/ murein hydrolase activator NlpD
MAKKIILLIFLFSLASCSSMRSGRYVYFPANQNLKDFARAYGVSVDEIELANGGKKISPHSWVFIPVNNVGILPQIYFHYDYGEFYGGNGEFAWPVPGYNRISSHFGRRGGKPHEGLDIPAPTGTPIIASESGKVVYSGSGIRGYGNLTIIAHKNGYFSVYAHADENLVKKGQSVRRGQQIALVGNTGRSTGPHLHFEIRKKSKALDPVAYFSKERNRIIAKN